MIESAVGELTAMVDTKSACPAVGRPRATHYRRQHPSAPRPRRERRPQPRALQPEERASVLDVLHSERFVDAAPPTIYATLLDEGIYLASVPTMYRILRSVDEVRERRRLAAHPAQVKPELLALGPNQTWSWDITKLLGPQKWTYFYLYVILDIFSRYVVGWMLAAKGTAALAERLLAETIVKQGVDRDQLTIHSDRGTSMAWSSPVAGRPGRDQELLAPALPQRQTPTRRRSSRPLKYRPDFPERFGSRGRPRLLQPFFSW
jgi:putative transposase